jgi:hypothetical protein
LGFGLRQHLRAASIWPGIARDLRLGIRAFAPHLRAARVQLREALLFVAERSRCVACSRLRSFNSAVNDRGSRRRRFARRSRRGASTVRRFLPRHHWPSRFDSRRVPASRAGTGGIFQVNQLPNPRALGRDDRFGRGAEPRRAKAACRFAAVCTPASSGSRSIPIYFGK